MGFLFSKKKKTIELKANKKEIIKCKLCREKKKKKKKKAKNKNTNTHQHNKS